jgi:hypothetical protein
MANEENSAALKLLPGRRLKTSLALAIAADVMQWFAFPVFLAGGASPVDDVVDIAMCALLNWLLGWHWEFAPSFIAKLLPGVDLVPFWTLAVANVYRKERRKAAAVLANQRG